ncbi:hypothetical protein PsorP6_010197 [Peronosclerospora sorghi]|uniref:Uncharacterized protein n=1 Tax=Peronosclerospora sorghi TaxID=230839 RepID=A0ACC0VUF8_9STRA|nr:hypothetical protein PsorP6_010197 [Peronosclerospora sorghi]
MRPRRRALQFWAERLWWKPAQRRAAAEQVQPAPKESRRQETDRARREAGEIDEEEELLMLGCAKMVDPTLPAFWEDFAAEYNSNRADGMLERTSRALNAHFARLARHKKPTGNPDCPQAV